MNDRVRIYELARKMNLDNQDIINALRELGYDIKSHSSTIDGQAVGLLITALGKKKQAQQVETAKATKTPKASSTKAVTPPPAPVVKPRVLARYRPTPPPADGEPVVTEPAPAVPGTIESKPIPPASQRQAVSGTPVGTKPTLPGTVSSTPVSKAAPPASSQPGTTPARPTAPAAKNEPAPPATPPVEEPPKEPTVSRAVAEQRAQLEQMQRSVVPKPKKPEPAEPTPPPVVEKKEESKESDKQAQGKKRPAVEEQPQSVEEPSEPGEFDATPSAFRGVSTGQSRPQSVPIRIAAPSFKATPPRPPKAHRNQPAERHGQKKEEKSRPAATVVEVPKVIALTNSLTVIDLANKMAVSETEIIKRLFMKGFMRTVNQLVELELAKDLAVEMGYELASEEDIQIAAAIAAEEAAPPKEELTEEDIAALVTRPPVVTIMGHVDHGKTSLLDAIRQTKFLLTDAEHGGITQHIGAYHVEVPGEDGSLRQIVFLDTPGHEAFTAMRARGAKATDIAILVVAADDGVMPQTIEAIDHAKAAGVPIIVAINKIDKGDADPERVLNDLMNHGLLPDRYGGETVTVNVSAKKRIGLDELLEMILLVADMQDLKANPEKPASGIIIEAELSRGKGAIATALVQNGTLREGDNIVVGSVTGRVRALFDDRGERVKAAGPSMPVEVSGLDSVPYSGDIFEVVPDPQAAKALAEQRRQQQIEKTRHRVTLESLHDLVETGEVHDLNLIVKADVLGTAEAIADQLMKLNAKEVQVRVLRAATGDISETDVNLAASSNAIIVGFNVQPDTNARNAAETGGVDIRTYSIIYQIIDDINLAIQGLLQPIKEEVHIGTAEIRQIFKLGKALQIAGCYVTNGKINRGAIARIERAGQTVYEGKIETLKRFKDDVREVAQGFECGMSFEKFNDLKEGDIVNAYIIQEKKRELTR